MPHTFARAPAICRSGHGLKPLPISNPAQAHLLYSYPPCLAKQNHQSISALSSFKLSTRTYAWMAVPLMLTAASTYPSATTMALQTFAWARPGIYPSHDAESMETIWQSLTLLPQSPHPHLSLHNSSPPRPEIRRHLHHHNRALLPRIPRLRIGPVRTLPSMSGVRPLPSPSHPARFTSLAPLTLSPHPQPD